MQAMIKPLPTTPFPFLSFLFFLPLLMSGFPALRPK